MSQCESISGENAGICTSWRDHISNKRLINACNKRWNDTVTPHHCTIEKQGDKKHEDVGRIRERTCGFAPTENLLIGPIGVSVAAPVIRKVTAVGFALFFCE